MYGALLGQFALKQGKFPHRDRRKSICSLLTKKGSNVARIWQFKAGESDVRGKCSFFLGDATCDHGCTNLGSQRLQARFRFKPDPQHPGTPSFGKAACSAEAKSEWRRLNPGKFAGQKVYGTLFHLAEKRQGQVNLTRRHPASTGYIHPQIADCFFEIIRNFYRNEKSHNAPTLWRS